MRRVPIKFAYGVLRQATNAGLSRHEIRRDIYSDYEMPGASDVSFESFCRLIHRTEQVGVNILAAYHNSYSILPGMMSLMPLQTLSELNSDCMLSGLKANLAKDSRTPVSPLHLRQLSDNEVEIEYLSPIPELQTSLFIPMGGFLILKSLVEYYLQGTGEEAEIHMNLSGGKAPAYERDLLDRLAVDCCLNRIRSVMSIRTPFLVTPYRYFNPHLSSMGLHSVAERVDTDSKLALITQVETLLKHYYWSSERFGERCELQDIARRLDMPTWTLKRRLSASGSSFLELHRQVLFERACELLRESGLSLDVISNQLGFVSQSSLTRFFKQCAGISPLKFRQQQ